jgi:DNA-binding transcriptional MerR regulator
MILRGKHLGFSLQDAATLISLYDIDSTQLKQYEEGIKLAYHHLKEVRERQKELKLLEEDLLEAIEDAETKYKNLREKGQHDD